MCFKACSDLPDPSVAIERFSWSTVVEGLRVRIHAKKAESLIPLVLIDRERLRGSAQTGGFTCSGRLRPALSPGKN